jgi:intein-encoded DNA endonuclease-like protein
MKVFSEIEVYEIIKSYKDGSKILDISKKFKTRPEKISKLLKDNGISVSSKNCYRVDYSLNHDYFEKVDTEEKAYFLGFLFADGGVAENSNTISLNINDIEILNKFSKEIELTKDFYKNPSHSKATTIYFSSFKMKNDLIKLGCTPRKSLTLKFPSLDLVPEYLIRHFIRGYFDGDGHIYVKKNIYQLGIMSSEYFCSELKLFFQKMGFIFYWDTVSSKAFRIRCCSKQQIINLRDYLYNDARIFLHRKYNKIKEI